MLVSTATLVIGCPDLTEAPDETDDDAGTTEAGTSMSSSTSPTAGPTTTPTTASTSSTSGSGSGSASGGSSGTTTDATSSESSGSSSDDGTTTGGTSSSTEGSSSSTEGPDPVCGDGVPEGDEECDDNNLDNTDGCLETCALARTCDQILSEVPGSSDGTYTIDPGDDGSFAVLCDMSTDGGGWTLAARLANADNVDNWMADDGGWWFDLEAEQGNPLSRVQLVDMLSESFWRVPGDEFKISRSDNDDAAHLLETTGGCLGGATFREFITGLGYDNSGAWATDEVLATCDVDFGNNYDETQGFEQAACVGDIGGPDTISFWANWHLTDNAFAADSSVMMIGGGGDDCNRADHGLGITEENDASFTVFGEMEGTFEADFSSDGFAAPNAEYALNIYVR